MSKYIPPGFDASRVLDGLHKAMGFGTPTRTEDQATFFFVRRDVPSQPHDGANVPFDPDVHNTNTAQPRSLIVDCAVEFYDRESVVESFGEVKPTRLKITILDPEWQQVKAFAYVVAGGDKYIRGIIEPPVALGTIDVWTIWANAEGES